LAGRKGSVGGPGGRKLFGVAFLAILVLFVTAYGLLSWQRYKAIRTVCAKAQAEHPGSRIEALVSSLNSTEVSLEEKNRIVWVLGECRDESALPVLRSLYHSETCDHSRFVCQREIRKALRKIDGDTPNPYFWQRIDGV
jgi:hypothetical protein